MSYGQQVKRARMDQITVAAGSAAVLEIYTADSPGTLLASFALNNPIAGAATGIGGVLTLSGFPKSAAASASGTAAYARIKTGGGTVVVDGMTVGVTTANDIQLSTVTVNSTQTITLATAYIQHADIIAPQVVAGVVSGVTLNGMETVTWQVETTTVDTGLSTIQDRFDDLAQWGTVNDSGCTSTIVSNQLSQAINASSATLGYTKLTTTNSAAMLASSVFVKFVRPLQGTFTAAGVECTFEVRGAAGRCLFAWSSSGVIQCFYDNNYAGNIYVNGTNYNATSHKWLRMREAAGTFYFETAPDAADGINPGTWSILGSVSTSLITWNLTSAQIRLSSGRGSTGQATTGPAQWDGLNLGITAAATTLANIQDHFPTTVDTAIWDETNGTGCDSNVVSGQLEQSIHATGTGYATLTSDTTSTIIGSAVYIKFVRPFQGTYTGNVVDCNFDVKLSSANAFCRILWNKDTLQTIKAYYNNNDGLGTIYVNGVTYDPVNHKWWRMRESGGVFYFELAPDGASNGPGAFSTFASIATSTLTWNLTSAKIKISSGRGVAGGTYTGPCQWDGLNTATNAIIAPPAPPPEESGGTTGLVGARVDAYTLQNLDQTTPRDEDIAYLAGQGFFRNRLPIRWELLQPVLPSSTAAIGVRTAYVPALVANGALYTNYRDRITSVLDAHAAAGSRCIIALCNGCRYIDFVYDTSGNVAGLVPGSSDGARQPYSTSGLGYERVFGGTGNTALSEADFADLWSRIAGYWGVNWNGTGVPHPGLGGYSIMDKSYGLTALTTWPAYATAAAAAIRQVDPTTTIYCCGNNYGYAQAWPANNPSFPIASTNITYEAFQYLDYPGNGVGFDWTTEASEGTSTTYASTNVLNFTSWLQSNSVKGAVITALPLDGTSDGVQANWNTAFTNLATAVVSRGYELYTLNGGNHWQAHGAPSNQVPMWYQDKTLGSLVGGLMKKSFGIAKATLWDSGANYWDPASGGGTAAMKMGVNIHSAWTSASFNQAVVDMLNYRNIKHVRMDYIYDANMTWPRDFITRFKAIGGTVEVTLQISYQWDQTTYTGGALAGVETSAYNQTVTAVNAMKDLVYDYEMLNEIDLRSPQMTSQVAPNEGQLEAAYTGKTAYISMAAVLRGMADAIHDVGASSGLPLRVILGTTGRDYGFPKYMTTLGVDWDVLGYHFYPPTTLVTTDSWFGTGGLMTQLNNNFPGKEITYNEFNGANIYNGGYGDAEGDSQSETGYLAMALNGTALYDQTTANLKKLVVYELFNDNNKAAPESDFGIFYDPASGGLSAPKISLYVTTALAGGNLSAAERAELITERSLFSGAKIDAIKAANGGSGGGPITITVGARGNITSNIVLSVASNAGGTLSASSLTLTAGANPTTSYTFTPAGADITTTLTYAITSGGQPGMVPPPPHIIYSYANPVALSTTNLAAAGKTLFAKYSVSLWQATHGYTDYLTGGVLSSTGSYVRAIADSGSGSTAKNPMEMLNWTNLDNNNASHGVPVKAVDASGKPYVYFNTNTFPLWCRKSLPVAGINPTPMNVMPFHLADSHFMMATVAVESGGSGTVMEASSGSGSGNLSRISINSSRVPSATIGSNTVTGTVMTVNQPYTLTLVSKTGTAGQRFRQEYVDVGTPGGATLPSTAKFDQLMIGGGHSAYTPTLSTKLRWFAAGAGVGNPSNNELGVMERYLASLAGGAEAPQGGGVPFGSRADGPYLYGSDVTVRTTTQMDTTLKAQYTAWKAVRVLTGVPASPTNPTQWPAITDGVYVNHSGANYLTNSDGIGHGMLLAVIFAGHDAGAQTMFNGLFKVARARYAYNQVVYNGPKGRYLMNWRIGRNGEMEDDAAAGKYGGGGWNAMDGDLDMAYALLMAHRQWGSGGTYNYLAEALLTIDAIKSLNMRSDGTMLSVFGASRTSDYMFGHMRAFREATADPFWDTAITRCHYLANRMQTVYSINPGGYSGAGLVPDFIMGTETSTPFPSTGGAGNGDGDFTADRYWVNALRCPFRWGADYVWSGNANVLSITNRINAFFHGISSSGVTVSNIKSGYYLNGTQVSTAGPNAVYIAPIMVGAMTSSTYQTLLNNGWLYNEANLTTGFYDGEIQLLSMVVASGNWWTPKPPPPGEPPPTPGLNAPITLLSNNNWYQSGEYWVFSNVWNPGSLSEGTYTGVNGSTYEEYFGINQDARGPNGEVACRFAGKFPHGSTEVKAYPAVLIGNKPAFYQAANALIDGSHPLILENGVTSSQIPSGKTPGSWFAKQLPLADNIQTSTQWQHNITPTGQGQLAFDIWTQNTATQGTTTSGVVIHEIMIPLTYWGNYGAHNPPGGGGRNPAWYDHDITIDGRLWHMYRAPPGGVGFWTMIAFVPSGDVPSGTTLNLKNMFQHLVDYGWATNQWMVSVELGVEAVYGTFDITLPSHRVWKP